MRSPSFRMKLLWSNQSLHNLRVNNLYTVVNYRRKIEIKTNGVCFSNKIGSISWSVIIYIFNLVVSNLGLIIFNDSLAMVTCSAVEIKREEQVSRPKLISIISHSLRSYRMSIADKKPRPSYRIAVRLSK